jgi:hypothetical protein
MEYFRYYLYGKEFTLVTDYKALEALKAKSHVQSDRITRCQKGIHSFSFIVDYRKEEQYLTQML